MLNLTNKKRMSWIPFLGIFMGIISSSITYADEFTQDFPKLSVRGSLGTKCVDATRSIVLPSGYELDYTQGSGQSYLITVVNERGTITRSHIINPTTKMLTSYVKVCARALSTAYYEGHHVLYGKKTPVKKGVTWQKTSPHDSINGIERVGCYNCDAYVGDTDCTTELPVLCVKQDGSPRPNYANIGTAHAMPVEFYNGWVGGHIATTLPVKGTSLTSSTVADATCAAAFGDGWRMAEHHDGRYVAGMTQNKFYGTSPTSPSPWATVTKSGGWGFFAYGNVIPNKKFWARVIDQPSACWDK